MRGEKWPSKGSNILDKSSSSLLYNLSLTSVTGILEMLRLKNGWLYQWRSCNVAVLHGRKWNFLDCRGFLLFIPLINVHYRHLELTVKGMLIWVERNWVSIVRGLLNYASQYSSVKVLISISVIRWTNYVLTRTLKIHRRPQAPWFSTKIAQNIAAPQSVLNPLWESNSQPRTCLMYVVWWYSCGL